MLRVTQDQWLYKFGGPGTLTKFRALLSAEGPPLNLLVPLMLCGARERSPAICRAQERRSPAFPLTLTTAQDHWKWYLRYITYDFLLSFSSNYITIMYCYWDIARYWSKIAHFPDPPVFHAPRGRDATGISVTKLDSWGYDTMVIAWWSIHSFWHITVMRRTDGRADRRTDRRTQQLYQYYALHSDAQ